MDELPVRTPGAREQCGLQAEASVLEPGVSAQRGAASTAWSGG